MISVFDSMDITAYLWRRRLGEGPEETGKATTSPLTTKPRQSGLFCDQP